MKKIAMTIRHTALMLLCLLACFASGTALAADTALFWALKRDGEPAGYLLGTIHSEDPRVLDFSESFIDQLNSNHYFAMEMVPDLPTLARLTDYMHYQDGTQLENVIGEQRFARLNQLLSGYKIPSDNIRRMKVWAVMMTLSVPPPRSGFFMDLSLSLRAAGAGLKVVGLETLEDQLSFLENMPLDQQLELLDQALEEFDRVTEVHDEMVDVYLGGDVKVLENMAEEQMSTLNPAARDYFMEQGIDARNERMVETLLPFLGEDQVFVAVGALHLPGEKGLVNLLRKNGFELEPLPLPFSATQ